MAKFFPCTVNTKATSRNGKSDNVEVHPRPWQWSKIVGSGVGFPVRNVWVWRLCSCHVTATYSFNCILNNQS